MKISGIILAGGESTRFNKNKINIRIGGIPLFLYQVFKLSFFCDEILIVSNLKNFGIIKNESEKIEKYFKTYFIEKRVVIPQVKIILDKEEFKDNNFKSIGPIAGICTGLMEAKNSYNIIQAFDMPFTSFNLYKLLITRSNPEKTDVVMVRTQKGLETLCTIYSKRCIDIILYNISKKIFKIIEILPYLNVSFINEEDLKEHKIDGLNFFNINKNIDNKKLNDIWNKGLLNNFGNFLANNYLNNNDKKWDNFFYRGLVEETLVKKF